MTLRLGTRGSQLALVQANAVAALLRDRAGVDCHIVVIKTSGDRMSNVPLGEAGGKRLFVKEIEDALLAGEIDLAVHSSKDLPAILPDGLAIGAVLPREDARDAIVLPAGHGPTSFEDLAARLGNRPRIGTSSVRRSAQLARALPGATFVAVRGNLDTRLAKLADGGYDALVLASAGLIRLGHRDRISVPLPIQSCIPAPGQGIVAVEIRRGDDRMSWTDVVTDRAAHAAFDAERAVVTRLGGGCQMPLGAFADVHDDVISIVATVLSLDGRVALRAESRGPVTAAMDVGHTVADALTAQGADRLLADVGRTQAETGGLRS